MSLLETKNKKFNLPFVFIAGAVFLVVLAFFANYLENIPKNALDLVVPKVSDVKENEKSVSVKVLKSLEIYLDLVKVETTQLEEKLKIQLEGYINPTIILEAEEGVPIEKVVHIMDIANKNQYKVILNARTQ